MPETRLLRLLTLSLTFAFVAKVHADAPSFAGLEVLEQPTAAPDVSLMDENGAVVPLDGAPVTVLNFWATWCAPCVAELPTLLALDETLGEDGLRVVAASLDRNFTQISGFWSKQGWGGNLDVVLDDKGRFFRSLSAEELGARGVPYTAILNAKGEIISWYAGETDWASPQVLAYFEGVLDEASSQR